MDFEGRIRPWAWGQGAGPGDVDSPRELLRLAWDSGRERGGLLEAREDWWDLNDPPRISALDLRKREGKVKPNSMRGRQLAQRKEATV